MMKNILLVVLAFFSFSSFALDFNYTKQGFWDEGNEYAVQGYDPVAYFTQDKAVKGSEDFKLDDYKGAPILFSSQQNLDLFKENPSKYAPQYGGYCAWRLAQDGEGVYGDPTLWTIVKGKLYLNYNKEVQSRWIKDIPTFIKQADEFWLGKNKFKSLN